MPHEEQRTKKECPLLNGSMTGRLMSDYMRGDKGIDVNKTRRMTELEKAFVKQIKKKLALKNQRASITKTESSEIEV